MRFVAEITVKKKEGPEHLEHLLFLYNAFNEDTIDRFLATGLSLEQARKTDVVDGS